MFRSLYQYLPAGFAAVVVAAEDPNADYCSLPG